MIDAATLTSDLEPEVMPAPQFLSSVRDQLDGAEPVGLTLVQLELAYPNGWRWVRTADAPGLVLLTEQSHFCAAHRLHNPDLSDAENQRLFGGCNNPAGRCLRASSEPSQVSSGGESAAPVRAGC